MIKVHLDTDLGGDIDDLCALAMLLKIPEVEITGITVVGDTNGKRTGYVHELLQIAGRKNIPIAQGADTSGGFYPYKLGLPKEEKYWLNPVKPMPNPPEKAITLLGKSIKQNATVIGIGPFTNLALLERKNPGILKQIKLFLMAGYIYPPRKGYPEWTNENDFNIQVDVKSAKYVLENSSPTLVPISITCETFLRRRDIKKVRQAGKLGQLLAKQAEAFAEDEKKDKVYGETCTSLPRDIINFQHDPLTCAIAVGWKQGIGIKEIPLMFEEKDSWLYERIDPSGKKVQAVTKVDGNLFNEYWLDQISKI